MDKRINGATSLFCLIGSPVAHSGSPAMHNYSFKRLGINAAYMAFDIQAEQVEEFMQAARLMNIKGFNATMPCKTETARLADELSPAAQIIGAANTIVNDNGRLIGHNTDGVGFVLNLADHGVSIKDKKITLMGGGGAGTAILAQLALDGAKSIDVFNRNGLNFHKLEEKAAMMKKMVSDCVVKVGNLFDESALNESAENCDILINATNVGMKPKNDQSLIQDLSVYREDMVVAEIIYNPLETKMMADAKAAGVKKIVGGKGMLLWQGVEAFKLFTGQDMPAQEVKALFFG